MPLECLVQINRCCILGLPTRSTPVSIGCGFISLFQTSSSTEPRMRGSLCSKKQGHLSVSRPCCIRWRVSSHEYAYRIPNPKHTPKYTKAKVLHTQDKHTQLSSFSELYCYPIENFAATSLPQYAYQSMLTHTHGRMAACTLENSTQVTESRTAFDWQIGSVSFCTGYE